MALSKHSRSLVKVTESMCPTEALETGNASMSASTGLQGGFPRGQDCDHSLAWHRTPFLRQVPPGRSPMVTETRASRPHCISMTHPLLLGWPWLGLPSLLPTGLAQTAPGDSSPPNQHSATVNCSQGQRVKPTKAREPSPYICKCHPQIRGRAGALTWGRGAPTAHTRACTGLRPETWVRAQAGHLQGSGPNHKAPF